jgi:hypothetical protein
MNVKINSRQRTGVQQAQFGWKSSWGVNGRLMRQFRQKIEKARTFSRSPKKQSIIN